MSGALWFFFWEEADWTGEEPPAPPPAPAPTPESIGGKKQKRPPYIPASPDFWDTRERYLRTLKSEIEIEPAPSPKETAKEAPKELPKQNPLPRYLAERPAAIQAIELAKNTTQLKAAGERLIALNRAIAQAKALRLQQLAVEAAQRRIRKSRRAKKRLALLLAAQTLLKFLFPWRS